MINSYSKIINYSENSSFFSKNSTTENSKINNQNLLPEEKEKKFNNNNIINDDLYELDNFDVEKDISIDEEQNETKPLNNRQGNTIMFLFNKNSFPLICIGPHCKIFLLLLLLLL